MILIYVTFSDEVEARKIATALLQQRLIACANIFPPHLSVYRWEGEVKEEREVAALLKAPADDYAEIERFILVQHSYDTPCIVSWPITQGALDFLKWVETETS